MVLPYPVCPLPQSLGYPSDFISPLWLIQSRNLHQGVPPPRSVRTLILYSFFFPRWSKKTYPRIPIEMSIFNLSRTLKKILFSIWPETYIFIFHFRHHTKLLPDQCLFLIHFTVHTLDPFGKTCWKPIWLTEFVWMSKILTKSRSSLLLWFLIGLSE